MALTMQRKKIILLAAACGAVLGALATIPHGKISARIPALAVDPATLAHNRYVLAAVPWVLFSAYWEFADRNTAAAKKSESSLSRGFHVFLTNIALLMEIAPIRGLGRFLPATSFVLAVGVAIDAMGLFLAIWARRDLGRYWSGEISIKVEHELIRSGPYRLLRHPIYTGLLTMYIGTAVTTGEWLAIVGLAIAVFAYCRKIGLEEANLRGAFGAEYDAYRRETWALVPGVF